MGSDEPLVTMTSSVGFGVTSSQARERIAKSRARDGSLRPRDGRQRCGPTVVPVLLLHGIREPWVCAAASLSL